MSVMVSEIYDALRKLGLDETTAANAARAVIGSNAREELATKADLQQLRVQIQSDLANVKADLTWRMVVMTGIFVAAVSALKIFG